jgi:cytochrome b
MIDNFWTYAQTNPVGAALIVALLMTVAGSVLGLVVALVRRDPGRLVRDFHTFGRASQGPRLAQERQDADLAELRKRVEQLGREPSDPQP